MLRRAAAGMPSSLFWLLVCGVLACVSFYTRGFFGTARPSSSNFLATHENTHTSDMADFDDRPRPQQGSLLSEEDANRKQYRVSYRAEVGAIVRGWPAKGGFYELYPCLTVELDFLGLDRFREVERPTSTRGSAEKREQQQQQEEEEEEEEAHCRRMRQLGAVWWRSEEDQIMSDLERQTSYSIDTDRVVRFGWPAKGGVWVLNTTSRQAWDLGTARINVAVNMEERCEVLETLGAVYYENPEECPELDLSG